MYTLDYFINKFEAIPDDKWTTGVLINDYGQRCAYGHCSELDDEELHFIESIVPDTEEAIALTLLTRDYWYKRDIKSTHPIIDINDSQYINDFGNTPKKRVLAALYQMKGSQQVQEIINQESELVTV